MFNSCSNLLATNFSVSPFEYMEDKMNKGFTLAEVLITLGIIGVVAAITIPTLIANTNS